MTTIHADATCTVVHDKDPGTDCVRITMVDPAGSIDLLYRYDLYAQVRRCNGTRRTHTVDVYRLNAIVDAVFQSPDGHRMVHGNPVPRRNMKTTIVTFVWATDIDGVRHVRIEIAAKAATSWADMDTVVPCRSARNQYAEQGLLHLAVYPQLYSTVAVGWSPYYGDDHPGKHAQARKFTRLIEANPADAVNWLALADWLDEQGDSPFPDYTRQVRAFFK